MFDYIDTNNNGRFDEGIDGLYDYEKWYQYTMADDLATTPNEAGYYEFDKLFEDTYIVREDLSNSRLDGTWVQTFLAAEGVLPDGDSWTPGTAATNGFDHEVAPIRVKRSATSTSATSEFRTFLWQFASGLVVAEGKLPRCPPGASHAERDGVVVAPITVTFDTVDGTAVDGVGDADLADYQQVVGGQYTFTPQGTPTTTWDTTSLTSNTKNDYDFAVSGNNVVWETNDGGDLDIFLSQWVGPGAKDSTAPIQISNSSADDYFGAVDGSNVVFVSGIGDNAEIYWWNLDAYNLNPTTYQAVPVRAVSNTYPDTSPKISSYTDLSGGIVTIVVWESQPQSGTTGLKEIWLWELKNDVPVGQPVNLTNNASSTISSPRFPGRTWFGLHSMALTRRSSSIATTWAAVPITSAEA